MSFHLPWVILKGKLEQNAVKYLLWNHKSLFLWKNIKLLWFLKSFFDFCSFFSLSLQKQYGKICWQLSFFRKNDTICFVNMCGQFWQSMTVILLREKALYERNQDDDWRRQAYDTFTYWILKCGQIIDHDSYVAGVGRVNFLPLRSGFEFFFIWRDLSHQ